MANAKYIIGIDFGHAETSAAYCEAVEDAQPIDISFDEAYTIPSAIGFEDNNPTPYIGGDVLNYTQKLSDELLINFKKKPSCMNADEKNLMATYFGEIFKRIISNYKFLQGNSDVYIACPSSWDEAEIESYKELAEEAFTKVAKNQNMNTPDVRIIKESRAAFVYALQNGLFGKNIEEYDGLSVVDLGSSTIDMTCFNRTALDTNIVEDGGYNHGASEIEDAMLRYFRKEDHDFDDYLKKHPKQEYKYLLKLRKYKEEIFLHPKREQNKELKYEKGNISRPFTEKKLVELCLPEYLENLRHDLERYYQNHIENQLEIKKVFLTGGPSQMSFVQDMVAEAWKVDKSEVKMEEPSLTVSRGIAWYGATMSEIAKVKDGIKEISKRKGKITKEIVETTRREYIGQKESLDGKTKNALRGELNSLGQTKRSLESYVKRVVEDIQQNLSVTYSIDHSDVEELDCLGKQISCLYKNVGSISQELCKPLQYEPLELTVRDVIDVSFVLEKIVYPEMSWMKRWWCRSFDSDAKQKHRVEEFLKRNDFSQKERRNIINQIENYDFSPKFDIVLSRYWRQNEDKIKKSIGERVSAEISRVGKIIRQCDELLK